MAKKRYLLMRISIRTRFWSGLTLVVLAVMWVSISGRATAQTYDPTHRYATVVPSPTNNGGKATWNIKTMSFVSQYPKGFDFVLDVTSTGGPIALATVVWRHSTIDPQFEFVKVDPSGQFIAHWVPPTGHNIPQWVGVDFWWKLTDSAGNVLETPHGYAEYADNTRKWKRTLSEDVVVHWEASLPDDIGKEVIAAMRDQRATYLRDWGRLMEKLTRNGARPFKSIGLMSRNRLISWHTPFCCTRWNSFIRRCLAS